ncbi:hypothetical protein CLOM_g18530 [Closterium sp. NIES-68]|nr:hypothetical protein CLOM_g18530 [Closterium sp. NIES-68]GJP59226.1 hypothetical protein CLOP_g9955 [Closterium sp. NIES-67]
MQTCKRARGNRRIGKFGGPTCNYRTGGTISKGVSCSGGKQRESDVVEKKQADTPESSVKESAAVMSANGDTSVEPRLNNRVPEWVCRETAMADPSVVGVALCYAMRRLATCTHAPTPAHEVVEESETLYEAWQGKITRLVGMPQA